ncbi:uncharacterized protein LOC128174577 [Crassostrea angulata]|uniref:uncharacterized protein LOC128174577 n=1 Tax=Magallana angulata TaxID=2784310 RepID=UPI0022B11CC4|nr:uncharacterized protein LOC128174577 [Crassostrea angulata]
MVCQELLSSPRLEGVKVLTKQLNLRAYDMEKVMVQFSDLQCDEILPRPGTKVFFGDRLCTHASTARQKSYPSTTTAMMETAAIGFMLFVFWKCLTCCRGPTVTVPASVQIPAHHQREPTPVPVLRRSRCARRAPQRYGFRSVWAINC